MGSKNSAVKLVVVKGDGRVVRLTDGVALSGENKTLDSELCLIVKPNDVVLMFVRNQVEDSFAAIGDTPGVLLGSITVENPGGGDTNGNHGHGNNADGVDGANPGNRSGGPNDGKEGTSGDDETHGKGK